MATDTPDATDRILIALIDDIARLQASATTRGQAEAALRALYDRTSGKLYGVALRVVGNREWAEDVVQEACLNIWRIAGDYRAALSPPMAWMGVITRSRALDFLRRRQSERADAALELDDAMADTLPADTPAQADLVLASQQARALHDCLSRLDGRQREVVSMAYMRDLSHSELADQLKIPLGTVKTWIRRGLEQLRGCMSRFA